MTSSTSTSVANYSWFYAEAPVDIVFESVPSGFYFGYVTTTYNDIGIYKFGQKQNYYTSLTFDVDAPTDFTLDSLDISPVVERRNVGETDTFVYPAVSGSTDYYMVELYADGELISSVTGSFSLIDSEPLVFSAESSFEIRITALYSYSFGDGKYYQDGEFMFEINATGEGVEKLPTVSDKIDIIEGQIDEVTGQLEEIHTTVVDIQEGVGQIVEQIDHISGTVDNIDSTVTDTSNQLKDPNSSIWQAAGSAISGVIEDLFVPSQEDITEVKQGFDELAKDKLGGAYTAMETVDDTIRDVTNKLNSPNPDVAIEFPGISVPLGGDVGTVVLAERQFVTLPTELTAILHPLAGTIFSIVCGLGTFNVLKDMVECFLSGFSYAGYLHRNRGGSDE